RPPMPPDDPAARDSAPNPQRPPKAGILQVEGNGYLDVLAAWDAANRQERATERETDAKAATEQVSANQPKPYASEKEICGAALGVTPTEFDRAFLSKLDHAAELGLTVRCELEGSPDGAGARCLDNDRGTTELPSDWKLQLPPVTETPPRQPQEKLEPPRGDHPFLLKLEQAAELGLINSREFQDR